MPTLTLPQSSSRAIFLMIAAIFCFTLMDASAKALAPRMGTLPTLWARYTGQTLFVLLLVLPRLPRVLKTRYPGLQLLRSLCLLGATGFFFTGLSQIGLAEATAVMNINPVLITLGAALFLGEAIGPRRLLGIAAALIGALIIIRPGSAVFDWAMLLPLASAFCYSAYTLTTRFVGRDEDLWTSLLYTGLFGTLVLSALLLPEWQTPDLLSALLMLAVAGCGTCGQLLLIRALMSGEAGLLAPFSYTGLIFATLWGMLFFDAFPDTMTLTGALVIALAGLYVWHRERSA